MTKIMTITLNTAYDLIGTLDELKINSVNRVETLGLYPGGKGINVAKVLRDLGIDVAVSGFIGQENSSDFEKMFNASNIEDLCMRVEGRTRINVKVTEKNSSVTELNFLGYNISEKDWNSFVEVSLNYARKFDIVAICGSLPLGVTSKLFAEWLTKMQQTGTKIILDTSLEALKQGVRAKPWLIKPNHHELAFLTDTPLNDLNEIISAAKKLVKQGVKNVVVSMGENGAVWVDDHHVILAQPPQCEDIVSTVGAGDTMVAGIIYGVINSFSLQKTFQFSTALATYSVSQEHIGIGDIHLLDPILNNIKITVIEG